MPIGYSFMTLAQDLTPKGREALGMPRKARRYLHFLAPEPSEEGESVPVPDDEDGESDEEEPSE